MNTNATTINNSSTANNATNATTTTHANVTFLKEPVDSWASIMDQNGVTMLEKFYEDQRKYAFSFQIMAYISRLSLLKKTIKLHTINRPSNSKVVIISIEGNIGSGKSTLLEHLRAHYGSVSSNSASTSADTIIITERSLHTDRMVFAKMLYESGLIEDVNYQIYLKWFDEFLEECPLHKIIYVSAEPTICHDRIAKRSRNGESNIKLNYLENCHYYHERMMKDLEIIPKLILNGNEDIFENAPIVGQWIELINSFMYYE